MDLRFNEMKDKLTNDKIRIEDCHLLKHKTYYVWNSNIDFCVNQKGDFPYYISINEIKVFFETIYLYNGKLFLEIDENVISVIRKKLYINKIIECMSRVFY